ncbi:Citrate synthase (si) [Klebsiella michiganensis]|uniref:citrate synthase (unknown stereospecificity) n=1 Tax=Klebsiella michiganensis TaxID=1134687 RepID=A0A7H4PQ59_9ENTR|nr:Citrate synthase (si) [Klebsiella michiganensis]
MSDMPLQVAMALEEVALTDPYFVENGLSPSVDFYTAVILKAMGPAFINVCGDYRRRPNAWLGGALERNARSAAEYLSPPADLYRRKAAGLRFAA